MSDEATSLAAEIDAIIAIATQTTAPSADVSTSASIDQPTSPAIDPVTADVDAILAEINNGAATPTAPVEATDKPKRSRNAKNTDTTPASPAPSEAVVDAAGAPAPAPAPAATTTDATAFLALLSDADRADYDTRFNAAAKKVQEKAENAVAAITTGKKLSRFTSLAVKELVDKRTVTSGDLQKVYEGVGLSLGTARAQSQQMTSLFRMFGLVSQDGRSFTLANDELGKQLASVAA